MHIPHCVLLLLEQKCRITLIHGGWVDTRSYYLTTQILKVVCTLNLDTLLPNMTELVHNFTQITEVYSSTPDLTYQPLENTEMEMFIDESSFITWGLQKGKYAVITHQEILKAEALPPGMSAKKAEPSHEPYTLEQRQNK